LNGKFAVNQGSVYSGTATWSSGTTATASQTLTLSAVGTATTVSHEVFVTNNSPYDITATLYKTISAGATSFNADIGVSFVVPATAITAGVTVSAKSAQVQGLYNINKGGIIRLTLTAAVTATVTNYVLIKELDL
jgi:hypothetical protein